jgi:hypothetical protein
LNAQENETEPGNTTITYHFIPKQKDGDSVD